MPESQTPPAADLGGLRRLLVQHFSANDLRSLCQDLGVDYDVLPGEGTDAKARELIAFMQRRDRLADLIAAATRERPQGARGDAGEELPAILSSPGSPAAADAEIHEVAQIGNPIIRAWRGATARISRVLQIGGGRIEIGGDARADEESPRR